MKTTPVITGDLYTPLTGKKDSFTQPSTSFSDTLKKAIREVNTLQNKADEAVTKLQLNHEGSIHEAIIALEKADISFRAMLQIRNKVLDAYQEIMRMTV